MLVQFMTFFVQLEISSLVSSISDFSIGIVPRVPPNVDKRTRLACLLFDLRLRTTDKTPIIITRITTTGTTTATMIVTNSLLDPLDFAESNGAH